MSNIIVFQINISKVTEIEGEPVPIEKRTV